MSDKRLDDAYAADRRDRDDRRDIAPDLAAAGLLLNGSEDEDDLFDDPEEAELPGFLATNGPPRRYCVLERTERRMRPDAKKPRRVGTAGMAGKKDAVVFAWGEDFVTLEAPAGYMERPVEERSLARFVPEPERWKLPEGKKDPWPWDPPEPYGEPWPNEVHVTVADLPLLPEDGRAELASLISEPRGGHNYGRRKTTELPHDEGGHGGDGWGDLDEGTPAKQLTRGEDVVGWHLAWPDPTGEPPGRPAAVLTEAVEEAALARISTREDFARLTRRGGRRTEAERLERQALGARVAAALRTGRGLGIEKMLTEVYGCNRTTLHRLAALAGPSMQQ